MYSTNKDPIHNYLYKPLGNSIKNISQKKNVGFQIQVMLLPHGSHVELFPDILNVLVVFFGNVGVVTSLNRIPLSIEVCCRSVFPVSPHSCRDTHLFFSVI